MGPLSYMYVTIIIWKSSNCRNLLRLFLNAAWDVISTHLKNSVLVISGELRPPKYPVFAETCSCLAQFSTWGFLLAMLPPLLYPYSAFLNFFFPALSTSSLHLRLKEMFSLPTLVQIQYFVRNETVQHLWL